MDYGQETEENDVRTKLAVRMLQAVTKLPAVKAVTSKRPVFVLKTKLYYKFLTT